MRLCVYATKDNMMHGLLGLGTGPFRLVPHTLHCAGSHMYLNAGHDQPGGSQCALLGRGMSKKFHLKKFKKKNFRTYIISAILQNR